MAAVALGVFQDQKDIGTLLHPGSASFDSKSGTYTLTASGENMWGAKDAFHFVFREARGELAIAADIAFEGRGTERHRKACLMLRQSLEADSAYVDVAVHGDGLTSLQFRETRGGLTHEIQSNRIAPGHVRLEKRGELVYLHVDSQFCGASHRIRLSDPFYAGLAVCSHNKDVSETARFSNVILDDNLKPSSNTLYNTLETQSIASTDRRAVFTTTDKIESPAWTVDGSAILFTISNQRYIISASAPWPKARPTSISAVGLIAGNTSPDSKKMLSISSSADRSHSAIRLISFPSTKSDVLAELQTPADLISPAWSPDSRKIAFISHHRVP